MTAAELLVTGLVCLATGLIAGLALSIHEARRAKQRWLTMPGAVDTEEPRDDMGSEVFDWQAYEGWSVKAQ